MSILINCAKCGKTLTAPDEWAGRKAKCGCGEIVAIPVLPDAPESAPAPAPQQQARRPQASQTPRSAGQPRTGVQSRTRRPVGRSAQRGRPQRAVQSLPCPECEGRTAPRKVFRMGTPVVVIGFILLLFAVGGLLTSAKIAFLGSSVSQELSGAVKQDLATSLQEAGVPQEIVAKVTAGQELAEDEMKSLSPEQQALVTGGAIGTGMADVGAEVGGALGKIVAVIVLIPSVIFCVIGLLLVRRRKIFECTKCGALAES